MVLIAAPAGEAAAAPAVAATPVVAVMSDTLETTEAPAEAFAAPPPLPDPVVEPASAAALPWMIITAASGVALAGVAAIAFFLWPGAETPDTPPQPVAANEQPTTAEPTPPSASKPAAEPTPEPELTSEEVAANESPAGGTAVDDLPVEPTEPVDEALLALPPDAVADDAAEDDGDNDENGVERVALASTAPVEEAPPVEETPSEIDPLSIDFNEVEIVLRKGHGAAPATAPADEPSKPTTRKPTEPSLDDELAAVAQHAGVYVRRGPTNEANGPFTGSSLTALTYAVPSVNLRDIPLDEALRVVGDVAGVPITIDPVALRLAGVSAAKPIDVVGEGVTLAELLETSLQPLRLGFDAEGSSVTVVRVDADKTRTIQHPVADLVEADETEMVALLRRLGKLPADSQFSDSKLGVTASLATQYDLVVLCERLRIARGLPLKTKYPGSLLSAEPSLATLAPVLDRRTTFSFVEPTPLTEVFGHWRRVTGLSILVDWRALAEIGYGPRSTVECSVTNRPFGVALDGVLGGLGLTWGAVDGRTLWLTTSDAARQPETIEFYPPGTTAPADVIAEVDPASGHVFVRAAVIEQRGISEDLAQQK